MNGIPINQPLPGCGFTIQSSPPHYSPGHLNHTPPDRLVSTQHFIRPLTPFGLDKPVNSFHTPFGGQTTLDMFKGF